MPACLWGELALLVAAFALLALAVCRVPLKLDPLALALAAWVAAQGLGLLCR